jgi:hypothetical protein
MSDIQITVYVGQALTGAPKFFVEDFQNELKSELRKIPEIEAVLDFVGLVDGTPIQVFLHDRNCTQHSKLCIFIVDFASTGLGMEIMIRYYTGGDMLFFARKESYITRMLRGFLEHTEKPLHIYEEVSDIISVVRQYLDQRAVSEK